MSCASWKGVASSVMAGNVGLVEKVAFKQKAEENSRVSNSMNMTLVTHETTK